MQMSELSIRRPVLATVMSLTVLLIGIVAYQRLSVREYPKIDEPVVTVSTKYQGASAEIVETPGYPTAGGIPCPASRAST